MGQVSKERNYLVVGLTGSIGSGKSAVATLWEMRGAKIVDADVLARDLVRPGQPALTEIVNHFGTRVLDPAGALNRSLLGEIVFANDGERAALEQILHPAIRAAAERLIAQFCAAARDATAPVVVVYVVPLLFERGTIPAVLDRIVVVSASDATLSKRIVARDGGDIATAARRLAAQLPSAEKVKRADIVIENEGNREQLAQRAEAVWHELLGAQRQLALAASR